MLGIEWIIAALIPGIPPGIIVEQTTATERFAPLMVDYKVVFWFDGTAWRSQAYDVRKGQYTEAVHRWVKRVEFDAFGFARPGPMATVREITLPEAPVESFQERLATAIRDELDRTLRGSRVPPRRSAANPSSVYHAPGPIDRGGTRSRLDRGPRPSPGSSGVAPVIPTQPFPYPYPRPHP